VTTLVWFYFFPREAAGASSTRHSPRPLMFRRLYDWQTRAEMRSEIGEVCVFTSEIAEECASVNAAGAYPSPQTVTNGGGKKEGGSLAAVGNAVRANSISVVPAKAGTHNHRA